MLGYKLVLCDVDQQVLLDKDLYAALGTVGDARGAAEKSNSHTGHGLDGDHDSGVEGAVDQMCHVLAQLLHAHVLVGIELDPDGTDAGGGVGILLGRGVGVLCEHFLGGLAGKVEARAAASGLVLARGEGAAWCLLGLAIFARISP